ncbi:hypothetical protein J6590_084466 [Homalodisca vitripennis]|nr:hypothetical protein J6590_084466 [Homalodisca vitripennis]
MNVITKMRDCDDSDDPDYDSENIEEDFRNSDTDTDFILYCSFVLLFVQLLSLRTKTVCRKHSSLRNGADFGTEMCTDSHFPELRSLINYKHFYITGKASSRKYTIITAMHRQETLVAMYTN